MLQAEPAVFGPVASDPTVSRLIDVLASAGPKVLAAIRTTGAHVREHVWKLAGQAAPDAGGQVIVEVDGVLVLANSEKQGAAANGKKKFGHHPLRQCALALDRCNHRRDQARGRAAPRRGRGSVSEGEQGLAVGGKQVAACHCRAQCSAVPMHHCVHVPRLPCALPANATCALQCINYQLSKQ
ncbi:hypothetical protein FHS41_002028 [Streptomyces violarus]|uniref:Uncharacterized protein n=1 Tax=Streptomyces violarus TaxID=67380 RepID=A0A7W5F0L1_9ACTN|nr:hypothetical protein [Streptomyces violarus]